MRLAILKQFPTRVIYLGLAALLLIILSLSDSSVNKPSSQSKPATLFPTKIQSEQTEIGEATTKESNTEESSGNQASNSTKVHVSVNTSTNNGETAGSSVVTITENGETNTYTQDLEDALNDNGFKISVKNGTFKFRSSFDEDTTSESETELDINEKSSTH